MGGGRGDGEGPWDTARWSAIRSLLSLFSVQPTLAVTELTTRWVLAMAALHAKRSGQHWLLASALGCAVMRDWPWEALGRARTQWPAQGSVMLSSVTSLHTIELHAAVLYVSALAARRQRGLSALQQAALAGLYAHLLKLGYDVNGPRFLWWTWHDDDTSVSKRLLTVPVSSWMSTLALGAAHSLCFSWLGTVGSVGAGRGDASVAVSLAPHLALLEQHHRALFTGVAAGADQFRAAVGDLSAPARTLVIATVSAAAAPALTGAAQVAALDTLGIPSSKAYRLLLAAMALLAGSGSGSDSGSGSGSGSAPARSQDDGLLAALVVFLAVQVCNAVVGDAEKHVSTGAHQPFGKPGVISKSSLGHPRSDFLSEDSPKAASRDDFVIEGVKKACAQRDLRRFQEAKTQLDVFIQRNDMDVKELSSSHAEAMELQARAVKRLQESVLQSPSKGRTDVLDDLVDTTNARVEELDRRLQQKVREAEEVGQRLASKRQALELRIQDTERALVQMEFDSSGDEIVPASAFGPASAWYTARGKTAPRPVLEKAAVCAASAAGVLALANAFA